jgi:two-component system, chemotaxis family, CheB/CheR fusion protein
MVRKSRSGGGGSRRKRPVRKAASRRRAPRAGAPPAHPQMKARPEPVVVDGETVDGHVALSDEARVPIVGVGASAGGLEALSQLLAALPETFEMAIVLIQHLAPQHESALPVLLGSVTKLPVVQAAEDMRVEGGRVYVIPPNVQMGIRDGVLHLNPRPTDRSQYNPIDFFFRCLAESAQDRAVAVVLSGTASDGAAGIRDVKAVGGTTFAQRPETAKYDGMPRSAIATGMVDLVLSPSEIAAELAHLASHSFVRRRSEPHAGGHPEVASDSDLARIFAMLRTTSGVDFRHYKLPTILRRLQRRMALHKIASIAGYVRYLEEAPSEALLLYQDILIHVTRFFREPDSFEALADQAFPQIAKVRSGEAPIRIWVCGCATGEEAYSVAIALLEYLGDQAGTFPIQIFATDVSETAIEVARNGLFTDAIAADVSPERLRRFFTRVEGGYRIGKSVRDLCVFARQDLSRDPPFSKLDLILCRNVLIYMNAALQRKLMAVFHYALRPNGFLMLGNAETIGAQSDLFGIADKKHRLYAKRTGEAASAVHFPVDSVRAAQAAPRRDATRARDEGRSIQHEANRVILERYAPPGVVVDADLHIVQFRGQTGGYLEPAPGDPSLSVLKMAREGLLYGLRAALQTARKKNVPVRRDGLRVRSNGGWCEVDLEVIPLPVGERHHYLVLFHETRPAPRASGARRQRKAAARRSAAKPSELAFAALQQELAASREHLQSIIQELEAANEELQSANEEILSSNEELQSTNEELDTAKEELQSTNEELNTVNEELHGRNEELSRVNSDLVNLLGSVEIAIVIVASDMRIRRFTPMAERILNLIPADVGRPIGQINPNIDCHDLEALIADSIDRVVSNEREVQDRSGTWYSLRVRPYKNVDNRIDGAVLSLFDVDSERRREHEVRAARDFARAVQDAVRQPLVVVGEDFRVHSVNRAFCAAFGVLAAQVEGRDVFAFATHGFALASVRDQLEPLLRKGAPFDDVLLSQEVPGARGRQLRASGRRIEPIGDDGAFTLLALEEASEDG